MGNSESKERQLFIEIIMQLLNSRGIKDRKTSVRSLSTFVQEQCPCFPEKSSSPEFPYPPALHPGALSDEISCFLSTCVSSDSSFINAQLQALEGVPLPATGGDSSSLRLTSGPLGVLRSQLACQWTRPSGRNWDPFVPGLLLTQTTGQSAPTSKEQETLLTSLRFPLSVLSLALPILPVFLIPLSWTQEFGRRASA